MKKTIAILTLLLNSPLCLAEDTGLFVEPAITYESSDFDVNYPFASSSGETNGFGLGARLGFHANDVLFIGIDGRYAKLDLEDSNSVFNYDADAEHFNLGPVIGIQMPVVGLRVWGTYIATATLDPKENSGLDLQFSQGTGYRIGAGFHVFALSLNLEYQKLDYDETSVQQAGPFVGSADGVNLENESWIASVSFPISI